MGCCGHKHAQSSVISNKPSRDNWQEVTVLITGKLSVPNWDVVKVHRGDRIKLPREYIKEHAEWFGMEEQSISRNDTYVNDVLGIRR